MVYTRNKWKAIHSSCKLNRYYLLGKTIVTFVFTSPLSPPPAPRRTQVCTEPNPRAGYVWTYDIM